MGGLVLFGLVIIVPSERKKSTLRESLSEQIFFFYRYDKVS